MARFVALVAGCALLVGVAHGAPRLSPRARLVAAGLLPAGAIGDPAAPDGRALVTVRVSGGARALARAGFQATPLAGEIAAVRVDAAALRRLAALPGVEAVEERRLLRPTLDQAGPQVGAPEARQETGLDGKNVLVGVVDTGVDVRHADLRTADGHTRIAALLDLSQPDDGRHPELSSFNGAVWLENEIDAAPAAEAAGMTPTVPVTERDTDGHGTHVAAIAVSGGLATGHGLPAGRYVGIAPGARLVVVQATHGGGSFTDADVLLGARFTVDEAGALGRPLVLNLSIGGGGGPHDGSTDLEEGLDALFPPDGAGRVLVVAAGNDGAHDLHAGGWDLGGEAVVPFTVSPSTSTGGMVTIELWYRGALSIAVESPGGFESPAAAPGKSVEATAPREGQIVIDDATQGPRADGLASASVNLMSLPGVPPAAGTWKLHLGGPAARWDAWILEAPPAPEFPRFTDHVSEDDRLDLPATATSAISVGSRVSRDQWTNLDGQLITRPLEIGAPSSFSGTGPTSDGRFAPDLLAPGEFVIAALSADTMPDQPSSVFFVPGSPHFAVADDGVHGVLRGTSQAAPVVAGAAALLLEADPTLSGGEIRELLRATARALEPGVGYSPRTGFGALDVLAAVRYLTGRRGGAVSPSASGVGVSRDALPPGDEQTIVTVTPRDSAGVPLGPGHAVDIEASAGEPAGPVEDAGFGRYQRAFFAHAPRGAVAVISATVDGVRLAAHPQVFFVVDRSEIGRPFVAAGGCQAGGSGPGAIGLFALALLGLLLARKLRRPRARPTL